MESLTLELRPRIQTCNAFIRMKDKVDTEKVNVKLLEGSIILMIGNNAVTFLTNFVRFIPTSLSALNIINDWICFRVQTKSESAFGSFNTEVVNNSMPKITFVKDTLKNNELLKTTDCIILCVCCKNVISKRAFFKRVLALPDMDYDPSEWFCCKHSHGNISVNLSPCDSDLFYGPFFSVIHTSLFNDNLRVDGNTIICKRCLQSLGKLHSNDSLKIWNCSVDYNSTNHFPIRAATSPLADFMIAVKTSLSGILGEEIVLQSYMEKVTHYLTVKPMDWHLNLMTEPKEILDKNIITLEKVSVIKVLYKYETCKSTVDCINTKYCEVGLAVIEAGLKHLLSSTKRFPQLYRVASDYFIGHIHLAESTSLK